MHDDYSLFEPLVDAHSSIHIDGDKQCDEVCFMASHLETLSHLCFVEN